MQNELKYTVRSREIVDLISAMRSSRLTLSPYFQRNLVWRDAHRRDFIDTILKGFPFPQIFLARGPIDLETMEASQAVVDGQQRLNSIRDFVNGALEVGGSKFRDLPPAEREAFLKYEVAVIDFDLDAGDPRLKDVFHRLNRTYYSLSAIEKLASEYSASEFMLVARVLSGEITKDAQEHEELGDVGSEEPGVEPLLGNIFSRDPGIEQSTWDWMVSRADGTMASLIRSKPIFSPFEFDRKVPLMFVLNVLCTCLTGYYNRNDRVRRFLDEKAENFSEMEWWNKANFFSLLVEVARNSDLRTQSPVDAAAKLAAFSTAMTPEYALAAREGVGRKAQRELRGSALRIALS